MDHGNGKPDDANIFLKPFVEEMKVLQQHGLICLNRNCHVYISKIICNSPARAFITKTTRHAGYESCSKCIQREEFSPHVILNNTFSDLGTDNSFRMRTNPGHHTGDSVLEELNIGMVSQIALDYMHIVCLCVTKRLLSLWVKGTRDVKLDDKTRDTVSKYLLTFKAHISAEFSRLPSALKDYMNWKESQTT
ncbi:uncharacterized protein LOC113381763 [Ctenocephalides felis]|uniref:uncharacterized protein LOC113367747 n=1 Tax=Ctenocephalides felis TaxID=7515 RepID=UPI000E6E3010|nr:uncharacterized protein LOC113367747 [Ctenocephalides felis]XP_026476265.1 uncharacterized protein LOC113381763 [Ctenocephalides felis]